MRERQNREGGTKERRKNREKEKKNKKDEVTLRCSTNYYSTTITCSSHSFIDGGEKQTARKMRGDRDTRGNKSMNERYTRQSERESKVDERTHSQTT